MRNPPFLHCVERRRTRHGPRLKVGKNPSFFITVFRCEGQSSVSRQEGAWLTGRCASGIRASWKAWQESCGNPWEHSRSRCSSSPFTAAQAAPSVHRPLPHLEPPSTSFSGPLMPSASARRRLAAFGGLCLPDRRPHRGSTGGSRPEKPRHSRGPDRPLP